MDPDHPGRIGGSICGESLTCGGCGDNSVHEMCTKVKQLTWFVDCTTGSPSVGRDPIIWSMQRLVKVIRLGVRQSGFRKRGTRYVAPVHAHGTRGRTKSLPSSLRIPIAQGACCKRSLDHMGASLVFPTVRFRTRRMGSSEDPNTYATITCTQASGRGVPADG